jgi:hypothetical protein
MASNPSGIPSNNNPFFEKKINGDGLKDCHKYFLKVFDNPQGEQVIKYLEEYSKFNFPNYLNVNATFAKAGQQQLVDHIKGLVAKAKKGGL